MHACVMNVRTGASENVAKSNWRFCIWLLMQKRGLRKIILSRLPVGHTHFVVDQRHSVFARFILGMLGVLGSCRKDIHSLGKHAQIVFINYYYALTDNTCMFKSYILFY